MGIIYGKFCAICGFGHNMPATQEDHATYKQCNACSQTKVLDDFPRNNGSWDGHRHTCSACVAQRKQVKQRQDMAAKEKYTRDEKQLWAYGYRKERIQRYEMDEEGDETWWEEVILSSPDGKPTTRRDALAAISAMQGSMSDAPSVDVTSLPIVSNASLPRLKGSERQIQYANRIRPGQLARTRQASPILQQRGVMPDISERFTQLISIDDAHWWIEHRYDAPLVLLRSANQGVNQRSAPYSTDRRIAHMRVDAIQQARRLLLGPTLFFDVETTGLASDAAIVEVAVARETGDMLLDTLVNPMRPIPADAIAIHHITDAMVTSAPTFGSIWPQLFPHFQHAHYLAAHNASFDMRIFRWQAHVLHMMDAAIPEFPERQADDTMRMYAAYSGLPSARIGLSDACRAMGISDHTGHRAANDVRNMLELVRRIAQEDRGENVPV